MAGRRAAIPPPCRDTCHRRRPAGRRGRPVTVKTTIVGPRPDRDVAVPTFAHLARLTDGTGLFEHARHATARREHAYCAADVARGLVVTSRESTSSAEVLRLAECYLSFLSHAQDAQG